jgi:E3 ubiquitin-protein ligase CHFR
VWRARGRPDPLSHTQIPIPPPRSPPPQIPTGDSHARPCPHCHPENPFGYRCLQPIPDPDAHPEQAWNLDDGPPPGHAFCGNW